MKTSKILFTGLLVLGLLFLSGMAAAQDNAADNSTGLAPVDDIQPYNGPIGADSPLYGLKIAMEDIDESFTSNQSERVDKQIGHARFRIAEVRRALELNQSDSAQQALNLYWQKLNLTQSTIASFGSNATGLLHAQEQIAKHQLVLEQLQFSHPNNTGLQRAYSNSLQLEEKFAEKTAVKFGRTTDKNNKTILKAIGLEQKEMERNGKLTVTTRTNETSSKVSELDQNDKNSHGKLTVTTRTNETFSKVSGFDQKDQNNHGKTTGSIQSNETFTQPSVTDTHGQQNGGEKNMNKQVGTTATSTATPQSTPSVTPSQQQGQQSAGNKQNDNNGNADTKGKGNSQNR